MKHEDLISQMTLEEKASLLSGGGEWISRNVKRLGLEHFTMSDGPHGVRRQAGAGDHLGLNKSLPATCFPPAGTVADSWDEELGQQIGEALGEEAAELGVDVLLGPGLNMKRIPLCGRNFEYYSEDPHLAGKMAAAYIRGIQSQGISACPKHFAVNSQETRRMAMNAVVDERTLREIYLTGFEIAVKEGHPRCIMSAYNEVNGIYANENAHLLKEILRDDWGFEGIVISDWGASNDHVLGVKNGADLEMPGCGYDSTRELVQAVKTGRLDEKDIDERVDGVVDEMLEKASQRKHAAHFDSKAHHELARRAAAESAVLLKNDDHLLPLKKGTKVAVIGDFAFTPRYQGAGSSLVNPTQLDSIVSMIPEFRELEVVGCERGYSRTGGPDAELKKKAVEIAGKADVVLYFFGLSEISESEGGDRTHLMIPDNQVDLLYTLSAANQNIVGVLSAGAAVDVSWEVCCRALLYNGLGGQAGSGAVLDILTGRVNPSGKLSESYPMDIKDTPAIRDYPASKRNSLYRESIYIGYRYYQKTKTKVRYPFGYGMSYTSFSYSGFEKTQKEGCKGVRFLVKNTGKVDGAEVAQMYVGVKNPEESAVFRAVRELKGFRRIFLKAGEEKEIFLPFDERTFRYFNVRTGRFEVESGIYRIEIGSSCEDIRLSMDTDVQGTDAAAPHPDGRERLPDYYSGNLRNISDREFEVLFGRDLPEDRWGGRLLPNDTFAQLSYARGWAGRLVYLILNSLKKNSEKKGVPNLNVLFIYNMPFRALAKMTGGAVNKTMATGIRNIFNGLFFTGLAKIIAGAVQNVCVNLRYSHKLKG